MDLTKDPIPLLIRRLAIPASVGFLFNTLYNVTDTFYAGLISTDALAALSLSFPIYFIIIALGAGISQGATALISNAIGSKDMRQARVFVIQSMVFGFLFGLLLTVAGLIAAPRLFQILGASGEYLEICNQYMQVILIGTVATVMQSVFNATLTAQGDTVSYRNVLIIGSILNLILDPWFLFGGLGLPAMGVRGIALATILIQAGGTVYLWTRVTRSNLWNGLKPSQLIPRLKTFREIAYQGIPAGINMSTVAIGIFVITYFISKFGNEGVAAYGIATRIEQIMLLPTIGLNIATLSLVGQNNGAGRIDRVAAAWSKATLYGTYMMLAGGAVLFVSAELLMGAFTKDETVVALGVEYLRVASVTLAAYVVLFQTVNLLQGLKRPMYAIGIGVYRQIVAPFVVFNLLAFRLGWDLTGIWWGIFAVTWSAAIVTWFYGRSILRRLGENAEPCLRE